MAILMMLELEGVTTDDYDALNAAMGVDENDLPQGLISHACGPTDDGLMIVDVWESAEDMNRFFESKLGPGMAQIGVESSAQPRVHHIHNRIEGAGSTAGVLMIAEVDGFDADAYDEMVGQMDPHAGDGSGHPSVSHVAATKDGGLVVVDVWESPEAFGSFAADQIGPAGEAAGMGPIEPRFVPVHNHFTAGSSG
jgi:heme-degrading monooxygenase HmoA